MNTDSYTIDIKKDLFSLREDNTPLNDKKFHDGLAFLANEALKALKKPDEVEWAFQQIEKLNTQKPSSNNTHTQVQTVFQKWTKIQLGNKSRYIPKEHLQKHCGKKFQGQFTTNMKDANSRTLELSPPEGVNISDIPAVVREGFLSYLQTGVLSDEAVEENVISFMDLAYQHQVDSLVEHCSSIIQANLDDENLETVLEFINNRHLPSLRWACLEYMFAHPEIIPEVLTNDDQEVLNLLKALPVTIELKMSTQGKLKVNITEKSKNSDFEYLEKINHNFPISSVHFLIEQEECLPLINKMSQQLKNIEKLIINDPSFSTGQYAKIQVQFPKLTTFGNVAPFLSNFDEVKVYLDNFRNPEEKETDASLNKLILRSLNLSAIDSLTDAQLEELTPYLQEIYYLSINSDKITKLIAPKASRVDCDGCTNLEILQVNRAIKVVCWGCTSLETLHADQAKEVNCKGCTNLKTLLANQTKEVDCRGCTSLKTLHADQAKMVCCSGCTNLKTLQVNQAEWVNCNGCTNLKTLQANQANSVDCDGCTSLETLQAKKANWVNCIGCTSLETLQANKAGWTNCIGCARLETLEVNQAEKVEWSGYTSLITLEANKAKWVFCKGCTSLKNLQANKAKWIYCKGCTSLETLKVNQAKTVDCSDCTSLKTLEAIRAKLVNCSGCTSLETLKVNQANKVDCDGCTSLIPLKQIQKKNRQK